MVQRLAGLKRTVHGGNSTGGLPGWGPRAGAGAEVVEQGGGFCELSLACFLPPLDWGYPGPLSLSCARDGRRYSCCGLSDGLAG